MSALDSGGWLRAVLRCPVTGGELVDRRDDDGALVALVSTTPDPALVYPVVDGVPVLLADEAVPDPDAPERSASAGAPGRG